MRECSAMGLRGCCRLVPFVLFLVLAAPVLRADEPGPSAGEGGASARAGPHDRRVPADIATAVLTNLTIDVNGMAGLAHGPDHLSGPVTTVTGPPDQHHGPVVAINSKSESIVAWTSSGFNSNIYVRRYDQNLSAIGGLKEVGTGRDSPAYPSLAVWPDDRFIIAWSDFRAGFSDSNVYAQMYDTAGSRIGGQLVISAALGDQRFPLVAVLPDSGFVVAWQDLWQDEIRLQKFDSYGEKADDEITAFRAMELQSYAMAANRLGDVAVAAVGKSLINDSRSLQARVFAHDGNASGNGTVIVPQKEAEIYPPSIAALSGNDFLIAWYEGLENSTARRIRPDGTLFGENAALRGPLPAVAALSSGGFIAATLEDWKNVSLQRYDANGIVEGPSWSPGAGYQGPLSTAIAVGPDDRLAVFWKKGLDMVSDELDLCQYYRSRTPQGRLETADLSAPHLVGWTNLTYDAVLPNASANSISFSFSTDGGASWHPVPANLSLAGAGLSPALRLQAGLATTDPATSPMLAALAAGYLADEAPTVAVPSTLTMWAGAQVTVTAKGSDPDGDTLTYLWTQTGGPDLGVNGTANATLTVAPKVAGNCTLAVVASDGWLSSAPARLHIVVEAPPPVRLSVKALGDSPFYKVRLEASVPAGTPYIIAYDFFFGDNTTSGWSASSNATHAYVRDGTYRANVSVLFADGTILTSEAVTVKARIRAEEPSVPMLVINAIIIIVVVVLLLAQVFLWRRGRVTVIPYQPPPGPPPH